MNFTKREVIDKILETQTDPKIITELEIIREYFNNPQFKKALENSVWATLQKGVA